MFECWKNRLIICLKSADASRWDDENTCTMPGDLNYEYKDNTKMFVALASIDLENGR